MKSSMKGVREALGVEAPSHMKGLQMFISDIRNCPNKEAEQKRVEKELSKIRLKFTNSKGLTGYDKKKYVWKLLYAYMLGYDIDFGHIQAVELCSSPKFSEKAAGYLAISLLLADNDNILRLVVNSIKTDMNSGNEQIAALALNTVANIGGAEFADNLFADISKMLLSQSPQHSGYMKRKACICLLRLYRRDQDTLQPELWRKKLADLFRDRDVGLLTSVSGFMLAILEQSSFPIAEWAEVFPAVTKCLHSMVQGECPEHYEYYHVAAPWLQTKLLRILQFFPAGMFDMDTMQRINGILHSILAKPAAQRAPPIMASSRKTRKADAERQNRSNAEHAVLFEAMNLMIHMENRCDLDTTVNAAGLLGAFISSSDPNIRYLGLETMARLATNERAHEHLERYKNLILEKMHETDISIRRQALNLLYAVCRPENWQPIVDELLEILGVSDELLQEELVLKIAILAEKNAPNFRWYVDVIFRMLESAPDSVGDDVWYRVVQVVTGFEDGMDESEKLELQRHAAQKSFQILSSQYPHETLVKLGAYMIGEFGQLLPDSMPSRAKFDALSRHYSRASPALKAIITLASVKLYAASPEELRRDVLPMLENMQDAQDVELQIRSCELMALTKDEDLLDNVLMPMPQYAETVQRNNPLIQRLKFQNRSRAHTRAQLEEAAKSEGGVYKPGRGARTPRDSAGGAGGALALENAPGGNSPPRSPAAGGRMLALANGPTQAANESESGSGSDEESSDDDKAAKPQGNQGPGDAPPGQAPRDLWQQLGLMPSGRMFTSNALCLEMKQEYRQSMGYLTITYINNSREPINQIRVHMPEVPFMRCHTHTEAPTSLQPGQQGQHLVQVQCMRPFLTPVRYNVEYLIGQGGGGPVQLPFMLSAIITKFITPAEIQLEQFKSYFESLAGAPREVVLVSQAKQPPNQWPNYLTKGFNLFMLRESNPSCAFGAGTLHTGTPDPSKPGAMLTVPVMVRLEYDPGRQMVRLTVRSQHGEVTSSLAKVIESYLLMPAAEAAAV